MKYKGFHGRLYYDDDAEAFFCETIGHGFSAKVKGTSVDDLKRAFKAAIDRYLEECHAKGRKPETPFSGNFMLRISPDLHEQLSTAANRVGMSLNGYVTMILEKSRNDDDKTPHH